MHRLHAGLAAGFLFSMSACASFRAPALVLHGQVGIRSYEGTTGRRTGTRVSAGASLVMPLDAPARTPRFVEAAESQPLPRVLRPARCREPVVCQWEQVERERALSRARAWLELSR